MKHVQSITISKEHLSEDTLVAYEVYCNLPDPEKATINGYLQCFMEELKNCGATTAFELWAKLAYWMAERPSVQEFLHPEEATHGDTPAEKMRVWVKRYA